MRMQIPCSFRDRSCHGKTACETSPWALRKFAVEVSALAAFSEIAGAVGQDRLGQSTALGRLRHASSRALCRRQRAAVDQLQRCVDVSEIGRAPAVIGRSVAIRRACSGCRAGCRTPSPCPRSRAAVPATARSGSTEANSAACDCFNCRPLARPMVVAPRLAKESIERSRRKYLGWPRSASWSPARSSSPSAPG